ncbi:zinc metalloproteinase nas-14-like [Actinia tenebrosa]|uniref:Metalloendopeptidase n=1 Tax=Actinia tenebrosa TaxID=6105 RepID=A0A6P8HCI2_ACTTE|nr:zinc metalloproteinase nas-14-like [Actinia tenebrosa]XP_031550236.1 zinc metalloproteinase nas-14-like [Actinia tenebrosa]XP_031550237.1 zinc metalloproteinase nas-14-like [Actinia tenebrosa]
MGQLSAVLIGFLVLLVFNIVNLQGSVIRKSFYDSVLEGDDTIMDQISKVNEMTNHVAYEADIVLTERDESTVHERRKRRNAVRERKKLWPKRVVPYEISPGMEAYVDNILAAIKEFQKHTCLTFVQKTKERNWIKFTKDRGCWSYIGRIYWRKGEQNLSLGTRCNTKGIIMHEMMHAVGFWHEQSRPDRNQFVEILWENIQKGMESQFNKYKHNKVDNLGFTYDYQSIMHYGKKTFSRNGLPTIRSLDNPSMRLGSKDGFSPMDIEKMNALYECSQQESNGWSDWSIFTPCNNRCIKTRQRVCFSSDLEDCPGASSNRVKTQRLKCPPKECYTPVDGQWGRWSEWGACDKTCGYGVQKRKRSCNEPKPKHGGKECRGADTQKRMCNMRPCSDGNDKCNFEKDFCHWENIWSTTSTFHWRRQRGPTPSRNTGPMADHTTGKGYYVYLETSWPARLGYTSTLSSKWLEGSEARCLSFWYSMHGQSVGSIRVYITDDLDVRKLLWLRSGPQGWSWRKASIQINSHSRYKIIFEGVRGNGYTGDVALDDIAFVNENCERPDALYTHI